ncbi:uncharacterized protein [Montipora foliosa]|uniref:uncharacterized protein n=1 Tax=Montipora foliosa TaxID=591990 RepID=UPI0035F160A3
MVDADGNIHYSFAIGKSRLAPLKAITIPCLELSAAVVSVKLNNLIWRELDLPIEESIFWSDSTSVIQLIQNQTKRFQTFVANHLSIIHDGSSPDQWRYVDSRSNPADDASRSNCKTVNPLCPILIDGILCVGGRLQNAPIPTEVKHPVLLPKKHHVTDLIVRKYHDELGHAGGEHVLSSIRQKFWLVKGRVAVRRVLRECLYCRKRASPTGKQKMADLPPERLTPDRLRPPFTFLGIDYFGPFLVRLKRNSIKRYGCLFTCLASRAVHIEISHSLDTNSFIDALRRFIARRGSPEIIRSDNGTNFHGGKRELRSALSEWNHQKINAFASQREIKWIFNPPTASHMGGVWERIVQSV